tara:strand:+ start:7042 stop:7260 length:219 start_codon:yes stop_codon:yes gene_type:complete
MANDITNYLIVKEDRTLKRDPHSKAIINFDNNAYVRYMKKLSKFEAQEAEIEGLKSELKEIKEILNKILESK